MISGFVGPVATLIYGFQQTQITLKNLKNVNVLLKHIIFANRKKWSSTNYLCWTRRAPNNDEDPSNKFLQTLDMGSISTRKQETQNENIGRAGVDTSRPSMF